MLRLMHPLVDHNEIKRAYLARHDLPSGQIAVENRNTPAAMAQNVWHLIADKWNDVLFAPSTNAMDCHLDFFVSETIGFDTVCNFAKATAEKVEERWGGMVLALNRIIKKWKRSGQGDGGFQDDTNDDGTYYGALAGCTQEALDNHANFIKDGKESYLLYFWELIDGHGLLALAMQKLNDEVSATNGAAGVSIVVFHRRRDEKSTDDGNTGNKSDSGELKKMAASIDKYGSKMVAAAQIKANLKMNAVGAQIINTLRGQKRELVCQIAVETIKKNKVIVDVLTEQMTEIDKEIRVAECNVLPSTPVHNNRSPGDGYSAIG
jgi:hypothetical protein